MNSPQTPRISIAALIYKSTKFAQWCYDGVRTTTPQLETGEAEFYFIANDPEPDLIAYLQEHNIPHYVNENVRLTPSEMFSLGYAKPEYIRRIYQGWNEAIRRARGEYVCFIASDNYPAPGWLDSMLEAATKPLPPPYASARFVAAQSIERWHPRNGVFLGSVVGDYGRPGEFRRDAFFRHAKKLREDPYRAGKASRGGIYVPCLFRREDAEHVGFMPEGNLAGSSFDDVRTCGDAEFCQRLQAIGVQHITALDAIVYHLQEGEMRE